AAAALVLDIRVHEPEHLVQPLVDVIHGGAVDEGERLARDHHLHALALEDLVLWRDRIGVIQRIGEARAAALADAELQAQATATALQPPANVFRRARGPGNTH